MFHSFIGLSMSIPHLAHFVTFFTRLYVGDMVGLGIRLSDAGLGDYWDDVDAVVRNQLVEQQLTDPAALPPSG
jgi:hypothetical protein